jgi:hypothetical protein
MSTAMLADTPTQANEGEDGDVAQGGAWQDGLSCDDTVGHGEWPDEAGGGDAYDASCERRYEQYDAEDYQEHHELGYDDDDANENGDHQEQDFGGNLEGEAYDSLCV